METKYTQIRPEGMFSVVVERTTVNDTPLRMHYEYKFIAKAHQTQNDFINIFAELIIRHGKKSSLELFAKLMGVQEWGISATILTLTGAGIHEWTDSFAAAVAEALLRETTLSVGKIAAAAGWDLNDNGRSAFSHWFINRYKCSPLKWRKENSADFLR